MIALGIRLITTRPSWKLSTAAAFMLASFLSVATGLLIARSSLLVAAMLLLLPVAAWFALTHPGGALALLWLIALNGIPLINLQSETGQLRPTDATVAAMVAIAACRSVLMPSTRRRPPASILTACALFGIWWLFTFLRSVDDGIPATDALLFGRDFLSLILVIPTAWLLLGTAAARRECVLVLVGGASIYSLFYVAGALSIIDAVNFTHPQQIRVAGSVQRLYAPMNDLVVMVAVFGVAALATKPRGRSTPWIAALTVVTFAAFLLQLTRAAYLGMAVGGIIAVAIAMTRGIRVRRVLMRRATILFVTGGIATFGVVGLGAIPLPTGEISQRISSGLTDISDKSGTLGYRLNVYHDMLGVLGSDWPIGLGFLHPKDRYFPGLPAGTIRNADVGLMNAVMTMGLTGLALLFGILLAVARYVGRTRHERPAWLIIGVFSWLSVLVVTAPTLITLFSPTGLTSTGLTLAICGTALSHGNRPTRATTSLHIPKVAKSTESYR